MNINVEARIQGHYCVKYKDGEALAKTLIAEKPNDIHCFSEDTEILTKNGWKLFKDVSTSTLVAQYNSKTKISSWVEPTEVIWEDYEGDMISMKSYNTDQLITPQHRVYTEDYRTKKGSVALAESFINNKTYSDSRFICGGKISSGKNINSDFLKLLIATQADGFLAKDCSAIQFGFVKEDKVQRLLNILKKLNAEFSINKHFRKNRFETTIRLNSSDLTVNIRNMLTKEKELDYNLLELDEKCRNLIIQEIKHWDGTVTNSSVVLDITSEKTIDVLQSLASSLGIKTTKTIFTKKTKINTLKIYRLVISTVSDCVCGLNIERKVIPYKGKIGCVTVPDSLVVVRRNGKVFVSGNSLNSVKLGINRSDVKAVYYAVIYGAAAAKIAKMLNLNKKESGELITNFWNAMPALKELKEKVEAFWETTGKKYIIGLDNRKIFTRSKHSLLNSLFQSAGVICTKYTNIYMFDEFEKMGYCINPFKGRPDICEMIAYHDEAQLVVNPKLIEFKTFETEDEAKEFVSTYKGSQLSAITHSKKIYVALPSVVSIATEDAIKKVTKKLKLNVPLGFEYAIGNNWFSTH